MKRSNAVYQVSKRILVGFLLIYFLVIPAVGQTELKVGFSRIDVTPSEPVQMAGYASRKELSTGVHDPLYLRTVAFASGGQRLVLVSVDNLGFYRGTYDYVMEAIKSELGLTASELFLTAIHTHSAPTLTIDSEEGHPNNIRYTQRLRDWIIQGIREATGNLRPVEIGIGTGDSKAGVNRREQVGNGEVRLGRNPQGVHDTQVLAIALRTIEGNDYGVLYNYATHATSLGAANLTVSGDLIGISSQLLESWRGKGTTAVAFVGASGDIDPWYRVLPGFRSGEGWISETELLGRLLAVDVTHALEGIETYQAGVKLDSLVSTIHLPGKERGQAIPKREDHVPDVPLNLIAARIGDIGLVGMSAEVLTEVGWAIKKASPFRNTLVITHCNGAQGYLAPDHLYKEGGYEVVTSPFAPGAADLAVKEVLRMLYQLQSNP